jgi:hypothetical protein
MGVISGVGGADGMIIGIGMSGTEDVVAAIGRIDQRLEQLVNQTGQHSKNAATNISPFSTQLGAVAAEFDAVFMAAKTCFEGIAAVIKPAYMAVEDFNLQLYKGAAMIASNAEGDAKAAYDNGKKYYQSLMPIFMQMDSRSPAELKHFMEVNNQLMLKGIYLDSNNKKQLQGFENLVNAIYMQTGAQNKDIQMSQETMGLLNGQTGIHETIGRYLKQHVADWDNVLKKGLEQKDILEKLVDPLKGFGAASDDMQNTWSAISSSFGTIYTMMMNAGFRDGYNFINEQLKAGQEWLKKNEEMISNGIHRAWLGVKGVVETVGVILNSKVGAEMEKGVKLIGMAFSGWNMIAAIVLPTVAEKIFAIGNIIMSFPSMAMSFGRIMLDSIGMVAEKMPVVGKIIWNAITLNWEGLKQAGKEFGNEGVYQKLLTVNVEKFKSEVGEIKKNMVSLYDWSGAEKRLDDYFASTKKAKEAFTQPTGGGAPPKTKEDKDAIRAAEIEAKAELEAKLKTNAAVLSALESSLKEESILNEAAHKRNQISDEAYFETKRFIIESEHNAKQSQLLADAKATDEWETTALSKAGKSAAAKEQIEKEYGSRIDKIRADWDKDSQSTHNNLISLDEALKDARIKNLLIWVEIEGRWATRRQNQAREQLRLEQDLADRRLDLNAGGLAGKFRTQERDLDLNNPKSGISQFAGFANTDAEFEERAAQYRKSYLEQLQKEKEVLALNNESDPMAKSQLELQSKMQAWQAEQIAWGNHLNALKNAGVISETEAQLSRTQITNTYTNMRKQAELKATTDIINTVGQGVSDVGNFANAMMNLVGKKSKEAFIVQKGVRSAEAVVNTALGVTKALATYPPYVDFVMAGLVAATGAAQIATIWGTDDSGGSAGSVTAPSSGSQSLPTQPSGSSQPSGPSNITIHIEGVYDATGFQQLVDDKLIPALTDAMSRNRAFAS